MNCIINFVCLLILCKVRPGWVVSYMEPCAEDGASGSLWNKEQIFIYHIIKTSKRKVTMTPSKSKPGDLWHLRHWKHFWKLRTIISTLNKEWTAIHDICPFFSTDKICGWIFLPTKVCKLRQRKISTKQRKLQKNGFYDSLMQQNTINCTHNFCTLQIFFTFLMWRAFFHMTIYHVEDFSTWQSVMWRISPHDNLLCE